MKVNANRRDNNNYHIAFTYFGHVFLLDVHVYDTYMTQAYN